MFRGKSSPPFASRCFAPFPSPTPCRHRCQRARLNFGTGSSSAPVRFGLGCRAWRAMIRNPDRFNISKDNAWNITRQASASSMRLPCNPQTCNSRPVHSTCCETSRNVAKEPLDTPSAVEKILVNMAAGWYPLIHEVLAPRIIGAW